MQIIYTSLQATMPASHHSVFTGRIPFLSPNQQCQSSVGTDCNNKTVQKCIKYTSVDRTNDNWSINIQYTISFVWNNGSAVNNNTTTTTTTTTILQLSGFCLGLPKWASTRQVKPIWIYWSKRKWMAVASARPYANLQLAQTNNHASTQPQRE